MFQNWTKTTITTPQIGPKNHTNSREKHADNNVPKRKDNNNNNRKIATR